MYTIVLNKKHHKAIGKLSRVDQARVYTNLKELEADPRPSGKKIKCFYGIVHGYRLRVGSVRVVYSVEDTKRQVFVVDVGYRGDIY